MYSVEWERHALDRLAALLIPLRSNASVLLTGSPIRMMRRRIKFASLFFDEVPGEGHRERSGPGS